MNAFLKKHKFDIILIASLLVIAVALIAFFEFTKTKGGYVSVSVDKKTVDTYPLDVNGKFKIGNDEHFNILVIEDGSARISEASCPDKLCINQGKVAFNSEQLICLPNKTIVTVVTENESGSDF